MRGNDQRSPQEGKGSRTASYAVHTPPIHAFFSLFSCPYKISQQSHSSCAPPHYISHKRGIVKTWDPVWGTGNNAFQAP